jgi:TPR repeat protein
VRPRLVAIGLAWLTLSAAAAAATPLPPPPRELAVPAEAGDTQSMVRLGRWYLVHEDPQSARGLFERAAYQGELDAMLSLFDLWGLQLQHEPDARAQGQRWLDRAKAILERQARKGDVAAQLRLAQIWERDPGAFAESISWYRAAAAGGSSEAMYSLSQRYRLSWGVEQDPVEAAAWLKRAAEHGHRAAMEDLARRYRDGDGLPRDASLATAWARKASEAPASSQVSTTVSFWDFPQSPDINGVTLTPPYPR